MTITSQNPAGIRSRNVLWIDDEIAADDALLRTLEEEGVRVDVATSGTEGLAVALGDAHDAIIVDLKLPDMFGLTVLRRLAAVTPIPIAVITGYYVEPEIQAAARSLGAAAFIFKPVLGPHPILTFLDGSRSQTTVQAAVGAEDLAQSHSRDALLAIGIRALLDRRQTLSSFLAWASAVRLVMTDGAAPVPCLRAEMRHRLAEAATVPPVDHPKLRQILDEIEREGTRQQERAVAKRHRISRWHLSRLIFRQTGRHYSDWVRGAVIRAAMGQVVETTEQFSQIAYRHGYQHLSQFDHDFSVTLGCSPRQLRSAARVAPIVQDHNYT